MDTDLATMAEAARGTIKRERVTWVRWDRAAMRDRISRPFVWTWTDESGTERCEDTRADALGAIAARFDQ